MNLYKQFHTSFSFPNRSDTTALIECKPLPYFFGSHGTTNKFSETLRQSTGDSSLMETEHLSISAGANANRRICVESVHNREKSKECNCLNRYVWEQKLPNCMRASLRCGMWKRACFGFVIKITGHLLCLTSTNEKTPWSIAATRYSRVDFQSPNSNSRKLSYCNAYIRGTIPANVCKWPHIYANPFSSSAMIRWKLFRSSFKVTMHAVG